MCFHDLRIFATTGFSKFVDSCWKENINSNLLCVMLFGLVFGDYGFGIYFSLRLLLEA